MTCHPERSAAESKDLLLCFSNAPKDKRLFDCVSLLRNFARNDKKERRATTS
jgi:hypothetical protein